MPSKLVLLVIVALLLAGTQGTAGAACGDSIVDAGEDCDGGICCSAGCTYLSSSTTCRDLAGECDIVEKCTGTAADCPADVFQPLNTSCRGVLGACDAEDLCSGTGPDCPDGFKAAGVECRAAQGAAPSTALSGSGVASTSATIATGNGSFKFKVGAGAEQTVAVTAATTLQQLIDAINTLGAGVTASALNLGTFLLRMVSDQAGTVGTLMITQDDTTLAVAVNQVGINSPCDVAEQCTGTAATCPADAFKPPTTVCRAAAGGCDLAELCTDKLCRGGTNMQEPCANGIGDCPDQGPGTSCGAACPKNEFSSDSTVCREKMGDCDVEEKCPGGSPSCPVDVKSTSECRMSAGLCDPAESCNGVDDDCPVDAFSPATTVCNRSGGDCDPEETCTGASPACPPDARTPAATICRAAADECDVAEKCDGTNVACPSDVFEPASTVCRPSADTQCDPEERCTGASAACPADAHASDGTTCDDTLGCTINDACTTGMCMGDPMTCGDAIVQTGCLEDCDDGNVVDGDGCSSICQAEPGLGCPVTPLVGCRQPVRSGKASVKIRDQEKIGGLKFKWKWIRGAAVSSAELGDPLTATNYQLCVYDQSGLLTQATAPAGGTCGVINPRPCWKARGTTKFSYNDPRLSILPGGIRKLQLRTGKDGKAKVVLQGAGGLFALPSNGGFGLTDLGMIQSPLTIQVQNSTGLCFEAVYSAPFARQEPGRFEDKAD